MLLNLQRGPSAISGENTVLSPLPIAIRCAVPVPIICRSESTSATVHHRTTGTKGSRSSMPATLLVFKFVTSMSKTLRRLDAKSGCRKSWKMRHFKMEAQSSPKFYSDVGGDYRYLGEDRFDASVDDQKAR